MIYILSTILFISTLWGTPSLSHAMDTNHSSRVSMDEMATKFRSKIQTLFNVDGAETTFLLKVKFPTDPFLTENGMSFFPDKEYFPWLEELIKQESPDQMVQFLDLSMNGSEIYTKAPFLLERMKLNLCLRESRNTHASESQISNNPHAFGPSVRLDFYASKYKYRESLLSSKIRKNDCTSLKTWIDSLDRMNLETEEKMDLCFGTQPQRLKKLLESRPDIYQREKNTPHETAYDIYSRMKFEKVDDIKTCDQLHDYIVKNYGK